MKQVNLFTSNLSGKALISEKSESKKAINAALKDYESAIDAAFTQVIKSTDRRARNVANAAKGKFHTAIEVVANCYPYQTSDGTLCVKKTITDDAGNKSKVWAAKKLTAAAARGIVKEALKCFTDGVGSPDVQTVTIGAEVKK